jgi:hypothetical protein
MKITCPSNKLDYKLIGPYPILEKIGSKVYKLELPPRIQIHPVFHLSLLELAATRNPPMPRHIQPPPPLVIINGKEEWEVEEILNSHYHCNRL